MRHFNILVLAVCVSSFVVAQETRLSVEIMVTDEGLPILSEELRYSSEFDEFLEAVHRNHQGDGRLKAELNCLDLRWEENSLDQLKVFWSLEASKPVIIDSVVALGIETVNQRVLSGIFSQLKSSIASDVTIDRSRKILHGYNFLVNNKSPYYATYGDDRVALVIPLKDNFHNSFLGTAGYQPDINGKGKITGELQLHVENVLGTASVGDLWWYRKDQHSQDFSLSYEEPFVWRFNLGAKAGFHQNLQDGLYVKRKLRISVVKSYSKMGKWYVGGEKSTVTITEAGCSFGLSNQAVKSFIVENEWERRDSHWNPSKGFYFWWNGEFGDFSSETVESAFLARLQVRSEIIRPLSRRWHLSFRSWGGFVKLFGMQVAPLTEQFRYGGASTLRGYREQQFSSDWMVINQIEFRYHLTNSNRIHLFNDIGFQGVYNDIFLSMGIGIQQKTPIGLLRLEYALNRNDKPSSGKIHFRLIGRF